MSGIPEVSGDQKQRSHPCIETLDQALVLGVSAYLYKYKCGSDARFNTNEKGKIRHMLTLRDCRHMHSMIP